VITIYYAYQTKKQVNATVEMAKTTVKLAREDREFRLLESKLEKVYSPLRQIFSVAENNKERERKILEKAKLEGKPEIMGSGVTGTFVFDDNDYQKIKDIYRYNSHYLSKELRKIIYDKIIIESDYTKRMFTPNQLKSAFELIKKTFDNLMSELEELGVK